MDILGEQEWRKYRRKCWGRGRREVGKRRDGLILSGPPELLNCKVLGYANI